MAKKLIWSTTVQILDRENQSSWNDDISQTTDAMRVILVPKESYWSLLQLCPWWENLFQKLTCPETMLNRDCTKLTVFRTRRKQISTKPQPKPPLNSRSKPQKSTQKEGIRVENPHLGQPRATWQELRIFLFLLLLLLPFSLSPPPLLLHRPAAPQSTRCRWEGMGRSSAQGK